jgi:hypothetical protein
VPINLGRALVGVAKARTGYLAGDMQRRQAEEAAAQQAAQADFARQKFVQDLLLERAKLNQGDARLGLDRDRLTADTGRYTADRASREKVSAAGLKAAADRLKEQEAFQTGQTASQQTFTAGENAKNRAAQLQAAQIRAAQQAATAAGKAGGTRLPASEAGKLGEAQGLIDLVRRARSLYDPANLGTENVTGPVKGRLAPLQKAFGMQSPKATQAQQALSNITTTLTLLRSGAAVTDAEFRRLSALVPSQNEDEESVRQKLDNLSKEIDVVLSAKKDAFGQAGYNVSGFGQPTAGRAKPAASVLSKYGLEPPPPRKP